MAISAVAKIKRGIIARFYCISVMLLYIDQAVKKGQIFILLGRAAVAKWLRYQPSNLVRLITVGSTHRPNLIIDNEKFKTSTTIKV